MIADLFLHEDLSKPENRINLGIFGMMAVPAFRQWMQERLGLPSTAVLYPPVNWHEGGVRPDFAVKDTITDQTLAWVEVECGKDEEQLARFRRLLTKPVLAIWGRPTPDADLSLAEIAHFLRCFEQDPEPQVRYNAAHLAQLIDEALNGSRSQAYKPTAVSAAMRGRPFVQRLEAALGPQLSYDLSQGFYRGVIRANTLSEAGGGYSLRVYSPVAKGRSLSVCNITGGRPQLRFSSRAKFQEYLPGHHESIERLVRLVGEMGGDMLTMDYKGFTAVPLETAADRAEELAAIVIALAA